MGGLLGLLGCGLAAPTRGTPVGNGVAHATFQQRMRHTDLVPVQVVFPADAEGAPVGAAHPALVFIQGGGVGIERYDWLADALAAKGYVTALPQHPNALAFFAIDDGRFVRELLQNPPLGSLLDGLTDPNQIAVAGHSLGGVVAVKVALTGQFHALVLLASYPDGADDGALPQLGMPSLSMSGDLDCNATLAQVTAGAKELPSPTAQLTLEGATHYQFTDSEQEDLNADCTPGIDLVTAHARMLNAVEIFLAAALGPVPGTGATELATLPGTEVTAR
jgi:pimeloyl-ACP methyl ester carboxylesterase